MKDLLKELEDKRDELYEEANKLRGERKYEEANEKLTRLLGVSDAITIILYSKHGKEFV